MTKKSLNIAEIEEAIERVDRGDREFVWSKLPELIKAAKERDEAINFAKEMQAVLAEPIACDVLLPPATKFSKGVSLSTIRAGIEQRRGRETEFASYAQANIALASLRALLAEAGEALEPFAKANFSFDGYSCEMAQVILDCEYLGTLRSTQDHAKLSGLVDRAASTLAAIQTALRDASPTMGKPE